MANLTPDERAHDLWMTYAIDEDAVELVANAIRAAENGALERAAERAAQLPNTAMAAMASASIRELKHPDGSSDV
jgi:hypothetical protein